MKRLSEVILIFVLVIVNGCTEESPDTGHIEYILKNISEVDVGFKVDLLSGGNASIIKDSVVIKAGEELLIIKSHNALEPDLILEKIEIWNSTFKEKYKDLSLDEYRIEHDRYILTIEMPHTNSSEIIRSYNSVHLYMDQSSIFGFYPRSDFPRQTYFFRTPDYFNEVFKQQTPTGNPHADFRMAAIFGETLIGYDAAVYADKTVFIRSSNNGATWQPLFEFGFGSPDDTFVATGFINENTGWIF